ncbi:ABC-2 family transporter protein [Clostridium amylolyticum]|uniref:ABC-2 family transporter protein n=1 Tax=Clostridium amylolyticum TaxID=1121298 RepID=A0A1M6F2A3_9CLOT|nr:ABC transporter permease subunit [Clostridium amylolyticum]SHI91874.1 ABC-2 family transporter protein [Clostridium amylolyticum]
MTKGQKAIMSKDIREITSNKQIFLPMFIVPIIFMLVLPTVLILSVKYGMDAIGNINGFQLLKKLPITSQEYNTNQLMILTALEYIFPSLFILLPIMNSTIIGASSFVGEKEHKTLETLLYTPISIEELFLSKIMGVFIPAYILSIASFILFGIVMNAAGIMFFSKLIFPSVKWLLILLWLTPGVTLLGITFMVIISAKAETFQEAQQMSAFIVIPVVIMIIAQSTGLFLINNFIILVSGLVIFFIDFIMIKKASKTFSPEKLI